MTALNQNFRMYSGDSKVIIIPVTRPDNSAAELTGASVKWALQTEDGLSSLISKQSPDIIIGNGNEIQIKLLPADTQNLESGMYYHECELKDQYNNISTICTGYITINKSTV